MFFSKASRECIKFHFDFRDLILQPTTTLEFSRCWGGNHPWYLKPLKFAVLSLLPCKLYWFLCFLSVDPLPGTSPDSSNWSIFRISHCPCLIFSLSLKESLLSRILVPVVPIASKALDFQIIFSINVKLLTVSYPVVEMSAIYFYVGPDFSAVFSSLAITIPHMASVSQNLKSDGKTRHMWINLGCKVANVPEYEYFHSWDLAH